MELGDSYEDEHDRPKTPSFSDRVSHGAFEYDGEYFDVNGVFMSNLDLLRADFLDDTHQANRERVHDKSSITAQFEHYGVPYTKSATLAELTKEMQEALRDGKFDSVAPSVAVTHDILRKKWEPIKARQDAEIEHHITKFRLWAVDKLDSKATLGEKAWFHPELFLRVYYLDNDGKPDRTKMPNLVTFLVLVGLDPFREARVHDLVPGLTIASHSWDLETRYIHEFRHVRIWIGWDADEVKHAKAEFVAKTDREVVELVAKHAAHEDRKIAEYRRHLERERLEEHHLYLAGEDRGEGRTVTTSAASECAKPSPLGRYVVSCPAFEGTNRWGIPAGLYITIRPQTIHELPDGSLEAVMEFGPEFAGKMLLFEHKDGLKSWLEEADGEDNIPANPFQRIRRMSGKCKNGENPESWHARHGSDSVPLIYHFCWQAFDIYGDRFIIYEDDYCGRIVFEDDSFTKFGGEIDFPEDIVLGKSFFGGGKVSDSLECADPEVDCLELEYPGPWDPADELNGESRDSDGDPLVQTWWDTSLFDDLEEEEEE